MIVHVIKKNKARYEFTFPDSATDEDVLQELVAAKRLFGYKGTVRKPDDFGRPVDYSDPTSGFAFDEETCRVVILKTTGAAPFEKVVLEAGKPVELRTIKG